MTRASVHRAAAGPNRLLALAVTVTLLAAPSGLLAQQVPSNLRWVALPSDSTERVWMDSIHITRVPGHVVLAWYKTRAAHESTTTVVHYAVDCPGFRLSTRRVTTYDRRGSVLNDGKAPSVFYYPPPLQPLQDFMHIVCRRL
jgi:hypothetical protein